MGIQCASRFLLFVLPLLEFKYTLGAVYGSWGSWSGCSASCNGNQARMRTCFGDGCSAATERRGCNTDGCPPDAAVVAIVAFVVFFVLAIAALICFIIRRRRKSHSHPFTQQINDTEHRGLSRGRSPIEENYYDDLDDDGNNDKDWGNHDDDYEDPSTYSTLYEGRIEPQHYQNLQRTARTPTEPDRQSQPDTHRTGSQKGEAPPYRPDRVIDPYKEDGSQAIKPYEENKSQTCAEKPGSSSQAGGPFPDSQSRLHSPKDEVSRPVTPGPGSRSVSRPDSHGSRPDSHPGSRSDSHPGSQTDSHPGSHPGSRTDSHPGSHIDHVPSDSPDNSTKPYEDDNSNAQPDLGKPDSEGQTDRQGTGGGPGNVPSDGLNSSGKPDPNNTEPDPDLGKPDSETSSHTTEPYGFDQSYFTPDLDKPDKTEPDSLPSHKGTAVHKAPVKDKSKPGNSRFQMPKLGNFNLAKRQKHRKKSSKKRHGSKVQPIEVVDPTRPVSSEEGNYLGTYLPELDQDGQEAQRAVDGMYSDGDSLDRVSLTESIREVSMQFDVESPESESSPKSSPRLPNGDIAKTTFATTTGTQTEDDSPYDQLSSWGKSTERDSYLY